MVISFEHCHNTFRNIFWPNFFLDFVCTWSMNLWLSCKILWEIWQSSIVENSYLKNKYKNHFKHHAYKNGGSLIRFLFRGRSKTTLTIKGGGELVKDNLQISEISTLNSKSYWVKLSTSGTPEGVKKVKK